jgi:hypothetical protein
MATPGFSDQNVYQMWIAGHEQGDVWIRRTTWSSLCARRSRRRNDRAGAVQRD